MTEIRFFRAATAAPLVIPALAGLAVVCLEPLESLPGVFTIRGYAGNIAFVGLYSAVPYLLFLLVLYGLIRPSNPETWRAVLGVAPFVIAVVFGTAMAIVGFIHGSHVVDAGAFFWGMLALITGYAYAAAIWLTLQLFRFVGWIND